jgi:hypothetical protein
MPAAISIDRRSYNNTHMTARGVHADGVEDTFKFTWVWAPSLTAYSNRLRRYLAPTEWQWVNEIQTWQGVTSEQQ